MQKKSQNELINRLTLLSFIIILVKYVISKNLKHLFTLYLCKNKCIAVTKKSFQYMYFQTRLEFHDYSNI